MTCADYGNPAIISQRSIRTQKCDEDLDFRVIRNDGSEQSLFWLLMARNLFHEQLMHMPEPYITRLVFNEHHQTIVLLQDGTVVGGIAFRPFHDLNFAEIAFCAISSQYQIKGFGSHVMAQLKTYLQAIRIHNLLTYADNSAIGYFQRQGFTREINLNPAIWRRCIKDYEGATLIHCRILPEVDYCRIHEVVAEQKRLVESLLPDYEVEAATAFPVKVVRGIRIEGEASFDLKAHMIWTIEQLKGHSRAWPFLKPVTKEDAPQYAEVVTSPMDLSTLETNVRNDKYQGLDQFERAARLIFSNCCKFNADDTVYYKCAKELEAYFNSLIDQWKRGAFQKVSGQK
jgi:histone acetyltransferase